MTVGQLRAEMSASELALWMAEDMIRDDEEDARRTAMRAEQLLRSR